MTLAHVLTSEERESLESLGREVLRCAAAAPDAHKAFAWSRAACECLRFASEPDAPLADAAKLFDALPFEAPFAAQWEKVTAPIAARAEAVNTVDIEQEIEREIDGTGRV